MFILFQNSLYIAMFLIYDLTEMPKPKLLPDLKLL